MNLCKTDKKDAFKLAYYGDKMQLTANYLYQVESETLKRYQQRREDLVLILSNEKKRLHHSILLVNEELVDEDQNQQVLGVSKPRSTAYIST
ncbi:hypothetical protein [Candidatus Tisiphia endosymbiont of Ditula angustiorana]|uniref:hypothetical protein n=1 Tax=Candidatus Tisiphia endosymbiont of Ditula angustiorana TaxID=3066272 RepID=UPI00312C83B5